MKIFNWMHRRLIPKDGLGQNVKKEEEILTVNDADTEALLENLVPADMLQFHGWRGADLLSIGTFGLEDNFSFGLTGKDEEIESEEDEYSDDHVDDFDECNDDNSSDGEHYEEEWNPLLYDKNGAPRPDATSIMNLDSKFLSPIDILLDLQDYSYSNNDNYEKMKKKERITLADLFSADDSENGSTKKPNSCKTTTPSQCIKKPITPKSPRPDHGAAKNGTLLFPKKKKFIPRFKEDSRPVQKLQGLMKRMLKKKIHPDVAQGKTKPCGAGNGMSAAQFGIGESVSLLQSQDAASGL